MLLGLPLAMPLFKTIKIIAPYKAVFREYFKKDWPKPWVLRTITAVLIESLNHSVMITNKVLSIKNALIKAEAAQILFSKGWQKFEIILLKFFS